MSAFHCRVRWRRKPEPFSYEKFLHQIEHWTIRTGVTILVVSWVIFHVWGDLRGLTAQASDGEQRAKTVNMSDVPNRSCRVSITDLDGIDHTATVSADTLYEAVARGLKAIRASSWAGQLPEGITIVTVCAAQPQVEHHVKVSAFKAWVNSPGGNPADKIARLRVREILGL